MPASDKIKNAKSTQWVANGIPKWEVYLIIYSTKLKIKIRKQYKIIINWFGNIKNVN